MVNVTVDPSSHKTCVSPDIIRQQYFQVSVLERAFGSFPIVADAPAKTTAIKVSEVDSRRTTTLSVFERDIGPKWNNLFQLFGPDDETQNHVHIVELAGSL